MDVWEVWIYDDNGEGPDGGEPLVLSAGESAERTVTVTWGENETSVAATPWRTVEDGAND